MAERGQAWVIFRREIGYKTPGIALFVFCLLDGKGVGMKKAAGIGVLIIVSFILLASQVYAQPLPIMKLSDVKPGMRGIAKTVIKGTEISEFNIEVIDIAKFPEGPGVSENTILVKASGDIIDKTGGIADGMSGSPVLIDGKVVGAIAFTTEPFADATIAGVTPIEDILGVKPTAVDTPTVTSAVSKDASLAVKTASGTFSLFPLPISLSCSGITRQRTLTRLGTEFLKHNMKLTPGSSKVEQKTFSLEPGSSIGVGLITGDINIGALGTLTFMDGDKFWAFGHPFFYWGDVEFPLTGSVINTVLKSFAVPFKFGSLLDTVGTVNADRGSGIAGVLGKRPKMVETTSTVTDVDRKRSLTLNADVVTDNRLLPSMGWAPFIETQDRVLDQIVRGTSQVKFTIEVQELKKPLVRENMFFDEFDVSFASTGEISEALSLFLFNRFKDVHITKVTAEADVTRARKTAAIEGIKVLSKTPTPGKTMKVEVTYRPWANENRYSGPTRTVVVDVKLPADFPSGCAIVSVRSPMPEIFPPLGEPLPGELPISEGPPSKMPSKAKTLEELVKEFEERGKNNEIEVEVAPAGLSELPGEPGKPEEPRDVITPHGTGCPEPLEPELQSIAKGKAEIDFVVEFLEGEEMVSTSTVVGKAAEFADVPKSHWAYNDIYYLVSIDVADGYTDGKFRPNAKISRQELASLLSRSAGLTPVGKPEKSFTDVSPKCWSFGYINSAVKAGYLEGISKTLFDPEGIATRAQAIKALACLSGLSSLAGEMTKQEANKTLIQFADASKVPDWAARYMAIASTKKLITGYPDGCIKPNQPITRAEAAKLLASVLRKSAP